MDSKWLGGFMFSKRNPQELWWNISLNIQTGIEAEVVVI